MADPDPRLIAALTDVVGREHVLTDADLRASYETDWTGRWSGAAAAVVRPANMVEIAQVLDVCATHDVPLVPQGGNTGLVGGGVPRGGEVVMSLRRLDGVYVDKEQGRVDVGAGATLAQVQRAAREAGWNFGVDLASRDSATIGGMIATNAGGVHVVRHGMMRRQVIGLEAIMADGSYIRPRMSGLPKDNSGYDLVELLVGSEGTLGVVIRAALRLVPIPRHRVCALVGLDSVQEAVNLLPRLRDLGTLEAAELMFDRGVHLVCMHTGLPLPFDPLPPVLALIECAGPDDPTEALAAALGDVTPVAVAVDREDRARLWAYRERHTEAINALGVPLKCDVGVRLPELDGFVYELGEQIEEAWPDAIVVLFGHLADGNVHVNVLPPESTDPLLGFPLRTVADVEAIIMELVVDSQGAVSAEHGIGVSKGTWLPRVREPGEVAAMRAIKRALDPRGILNPGVLFPPG